LSLAVTPGAIETCEVSYAVINVSGTITDSLSNSLVVTFAAQASDVFTASDYVLGGVFAGETPTVVQVGNVATFTFASGLVLTATGTITVPVYRDCGVTGPVTAGVAYQDNCAVSRTAGGTATSSTRISDVNLFTTPDQYVVNNKQAVWRYYVSSIGQKEALNLIVTNTLPVGHSFVAYTVTSTTAPTNVVSMITGTVGGREVATFTISSLPVGGRLQFDLESQIDSVCNLPAQIDIALWDDCGGVNGTCAGYQTGLVRLLPGPFFLLTSNDQVAALPLCAQGPVKLIVKNTSAKAPEFQFAITDVITNATFVVGSAFVTVTDSAGAVVTGQTSSQPLRNIAFPPVVVAMALGEMVTWHESDFASGTEAYDVLAERAASDVIEIVMLLQTSCTGTDAQVQAFVDAIDVCEQPLSSVEESQTLGTDIPVLEASKSGYNADTENPGDADAEVFASNGDTVIWQIDVTNDGDAHVTNLFVTDTVPADFTIVSVSSGGSFGGGVASWGSAGGLTLNVNETKSFIITGTIDGNTCALNRTNTALASYGCSTTDVCLGTPVSTNAVILKTQPDITEVESSFVIDQCNDQIRIRITNDGPPAQNVILTDTLPTEFVYESLVSATTMPSSLPSDGDSVAIFEWTSPISIPNGTTDLIVRVRNANTSGACTAPAGNVTNQMDTYYEDTCTTPTATFTRTDSNSHATNLPNLVAVKTPVSQVSDVGDTVTWDLYVNNTGTAIAPNVVVTDVISTNFNNVTGTISLVTGGSSNNPSAPGANIIAWTTPITIPVGGTWHAVVTADLLSSGNNTDTMTAVGNCASGCVFGTTSDVAFVTLLEEFDKGPEVQTDTIGAPVVFTITTGLSDQDGLYEGITFTDTLPTGLGYVAAELTYTEDGDGNGVGPIIITGVTPIITPGLYTTGDIIWQLGDVNGTVQVSGIITAVIQNILTNNHSDRVVNNIDLSYTQDTQYYTFTDNANVDIVEPFLNIEKDVEPLDAEPRDTAYYTITIYHEPSPVPVVSAFNVMITDVIPSDLTYDIGSFTQISGPAADTLNAGAAPTLTGFWSEIPITATQANPIRLRYTATVNEDAPVGESYTNIVTTTWTSLPNNPYGETRDGDGGNGGADDYVDSDPATIGLSEVWLNKTAPLSITAGTNITYNIYVTNDGPFTATAAIVTDTMPFQVNTLSAVYNVPSGNSGNCVITTGTPDVVVCSLGDILDDLTATITVVASVPADVPEGADLTNAAYVTVTSEDGDDTNNDDTEETEVYTESDNDVDKTCTTPVVAGQTVVCEVVLENLGPSVSRDVDIKDILPAGFTWVSGTATQGTCVNGICQYGDVDVNEIITATITATVGSDASGAYTNEAVVFADTSDPVPGNNSDTAPITVNTLTALQIAKVDLTDPVHTNQTYLYEIVITNTGPSVAQNVVITDDLPAEVTFEGASPGCTYSSGTVTCDLGSLAVDERRDFFINVRVDSGVVSGTVGTNQTAVTTSTPLDLANSTLTDSEDTTYLIQYSGGIADLVITKAVSPATRVAGNGQFTYVFTVTNNSLSPAAAVQVVDAFPREFNFVSATTSDGSICNSGTTCDLSVMLGGETTVITLVVDVPADAPAGTYTNTAYVGSAATESNYANNEDSATSTVTTNADLQIRKIDNPSPATPGEDLEYTIVVTNTGQSNAENVTVSDPLPAGFSLDFVLSSQGGCASLPCNLGTLAPNETATIWINGTVSASATGTLNNTATVTSSTPGSGDNDSTATPLSGGADLALVKTATPTVYAGEDIDYTITVYNQGTADITNATVTDTLPVSVTFSSASVGCSHAAGVVTCGTFNLIAGANTSYTITVTTADDIVPGSSLENTAIVGSPTPETDVENNQDDADTSILGKADLGLLKSGPANVTAGQQIAYTLVITNAGPSTARSVDVKDLLPAGLTFDSASTTQGFCVPGLCQFGDIGVSDIVTVVITATVGTDVTGSLDNTGQVFADTEDPDPTNDSDNAVTTINTSADVGVTKVDLMDPVAPDSTLIYELVVTNDGPSDAANVVVTDALDSNVTFVNASPDCSLSGSNVVCTVGTLAANSAVDYLVSVQVSDSAPTGTLLTNTITVTTTTTDPNSSNDSDSITTTVQQNLGLPVDLGITKSDNPASVVAGEIVTYTLTITNDGPEIATNVRVLELVPAGTTVQSVSVTNPDFVGEHCSQGGSCYLGTVFTDTTATIVMVLQVDDDYAAAVITNTASVAGDQQDSDPTDNIATELTNVTTSVDLTIQKNDLMDPVNAGEYILYQITITNTGSSAADNVIITDRVPVSTTFVGASPLCVESAGLITCSIGTLNSGERASVWVQVETDSRLANSSTVNNTAYVSSDTTETDDTNNSDPEDTTVNQPVLGATDLEITKSDNPGTVTAGETLTYTLVVTNNGPAQATNVLVVDALPDGVTFVSATASQGLCNGGVTCDLINLAVGASATVEVVVTVDSDQTADLLNVARVSAANLESDLSNNEATENTVVNEVADLEIVKDGPATATPGGSIEYEITVSNNGPSDALSVVVTDTIPTGLSNATASSSQGSCAIAAGLLTCNLGPLANGANATIAINADIDAGVSSDIVNTANASSPTDPTSPTIDASDTTTATLSASADLALDVGSTPTATAGETVTVTYTVYNSGPSDAENVVITATFPTEVTPPVGWNLVSGRTYTYSVGTVPVGSNTTVTENLPLNSDIEPGTSIEFPGEVDATTPDPNEDNNLDDADTSVVGEADLGLTKTGSATATAGETVQYTIVITNGGPSTAKNVDLKDLLPQGVNFQSYTATSGFCVSGLCQFGDVTVSDIITVVITGTVDSDVVGNITNEAQVFAYTDDPDPTNNNDDHDTLVGVSADLRVVKIDLQDPAPSASGLIYELIVINDGPSDAQNVFVTDTLSSAVTFAGASYGCTHDGSGTNGNVVCDVGTLAAGATAEYLISVKVGNVATGTVITNNVLVDSSTFDPDGTNNTDSITTTVEQDLGPSADLGITKVDTVDPVNAGELVTYTLTITNDGPAIATNVQVLELIPAGTTVSSISAANPSFVGEHCSNGGTCYIGTVYTNTTVIVTVVLLVDEDFTGTTLVNTASVSADQKDDDPGDNIASEITTVATQTDLLISKNDLMDPVLAGETILYQIVITNTGPSAAANVVITDQIPVSTTFTGASPLCTESGGLVTCQLGSLESGERDSVFVQVEVDSEVVDGTTVTNTTGVSTATPESDYTNNTDTEPTLINQSPLNPTDLEIAKSDSPDPVLAGETLTYTLVITNNGPAPAEDVLVVDALPDGVTFVSATASQGLCNGGVTCDLIDLAVDATATVQVVVTVDADQVGDLLNVARVSASNPESDDSNNQASEPTVVNEEADLEIVKSGPATATPGGTIAYQITVSNNGPSDAQSVVLTDTIPTDLSGATATSSQGSCSIAAGLLTCNLGTLANGASATIDINADINTAATGTVVNTANASSPTDPTSPTIDASDTTTATLETSADLALDVGSTPTVVAGENLTVTYTVYNAGPSDAENVVITATFPIEVTSAPTWAAPAGWTLISGSTYTYSVGTLAAGGSTVVTVPNLPTISDIEPGTSIEFPGEVDATTADPNVDNNVDDADTSVIGEADLGLVKSGPASVVAGETIAYTLVITNAGPSTAQSVDVKDLLPSGLTFESASTTQGFCVPGVCQLGDMTTSDIITIVVTATVGSDVTGSIVNEAQVFADTTDPNTANNNDDATTTVTTSADVSIVKVDLSDPVEPTRGLLYELVVSNAGPSDAQNVVFTDDLDVNVTFVNASPGCVESGGDVICTVGTLPAGTSVDYLISVQVGNVPSGTILANAVVVTTDTTDPEPANNTDSITTTVAQNLGPSADLGITKSDDPDSVVAGEYVTYTLTITNDGPAIATNVRVLELVPYGTTVQSLTADNPDFVGEHCSNGGSCYLGTVFTDTTATVIVVLQVDDDYTGATIANTASVAGDQQESDPSDNLASETTDVTTSVDLVIKKNDLIDPVLAGETILYQITVTNTGSSAAANVVITDSVPVSTTLVGTSPLCVESGGLVTCQIGDLGAGERASVWLQVETDERLSAGSTITNTAYVSSDTTETDNTNNREPEDTTVNQSPLNPTDLEIVKSDSPDPVLAGETLTYTLVITNNGPAPAEDVLVVDALPDGVTFVSATASQGLCNGGVTCDLIDLAVGANATVEIVVTVDADQITDLTNVARVSASNPESDDSNNEASETTTVNEAADLEVTKSGPATATPGGSLAYQITVSNNGPSDAQNVEATDTIPSSLSGAVATASQGSCAIITNVMVCNLGVLAAGATATIDIVADIDADATGDVVNTVVVASPTDPTDPNVDDSDTITTTLAASADLALNVGSTPTVTAGETVTVTYTAYNAGISDAENVVITATFPTEVTSALGWTTPAGWNLVGGNVYTYSVGSLAAGSETTVVVNVPVNSNIVPGTSIEFPGEIGSTTADPVVENNVDDADTSVVSEADLGVVKTGPATATAGEQVTYTLVVTNAGPSTAWSVDIKDVLPAGFTLDIATTTQGQCVSAICQVDDVLVGETITVTIVATVDSDTLAGTYTNTAQVFSDTPDPVSANNSDTQVTVVDTAALITIDKIDLFDPVDVGGNLIYQVTVENQGPSDAQNVVVTDTLPYSVTYQSDTAGCTHNSGILTCALGTLVAGESENFLVTVVVSNTIVSGTVLTNDVVLTTTTPILPGSVLTDTEDTLVEQNQDIPIDLQLRKDAAATVIAGEQLTYTIVVTNASVNSATNANVVDALPSGVDFMSATASNGGLCNSGIYCVLGTLAGSEVVTITVVVAVQTDQAGNTLNNNAVVNADQPDPTPEDAGDDADTVVTGLADIYIEKSADPDPAVVGEDLVYTLLVGNRGPSDAENVTVTDTLPVSFTLSSLSSSPGSCTSLPCNLGTLSPGDTETVTMIGTIDADATTALVNTAAVTSTTPVTNTIDDVDTITTTVQTVADVGILKVANSGTVSAGENVTYTLTVQNYGPSTAQNVQVSDAIPAGTTFVTASISYTGPDPLVFSLGNLAVDEVITFTVSVQSDNTLPDAYLINNTANVTTDSDDTNSANNSDNALVQAFRSADLQVDKAAFSSTVTAGETTFFTITLYNDGPSLASDVDVKELAPAGLTVANVATSQGACVGGICQLGNVAVDTTVVITVEATVDTDVISGTLLCNEGAVFADTMDPDNANNSNQACLTVETEADLVMTKAAPVQAQLPGETFVYTLQVENTGPSDAQDVVVTDSLPAELTFVDATPTQTSGPNPLTWNLGTLAAGETAEILVQVTVNAWVSQTFTNTATVAAATVDPNPSDNTASAPVDVTSQADLEIVKSASDTVAAGHTITYTLMVYNHGPAYAIGVTVTDVLHADVVFASASAGCTHFIGVVNCGPTNLAAGAAITYTLIVTADEGLEPGVSLENNARVGAETVDPNPVNDVDDADTSIIELVDLSIVKSDNDVTATAGELLTYTLTIQNAGPSVAQDVTVFDWLPDEVDFVSATPTKSGGPNPLIWLLDSLAVAETQVFTVVVRVKSNVTQTISNRGVINSTSPEANPGDNESIEPTPVDTLADVSIMKLADPDPVYAGDLLTYTLTIENDGPSDALNVIVTDTLPGDVSFVSTDTPQQAGPNPLNWNLGTLTPGETRTIIVVVEVDSDHTAPIFNFASVGSTTPDPVPGNNSAVEPVSVQVQADLTIKKTGSASPVLGGDTLVYTIEVYNAGPSDAQNVAVTDTLPSSVSFDFASPIQSSGPNPLTWDLGTVIAGVTETIYVQVQVDVNAIGTFENFVVVGSTTPDPVPENNETTEETVIEGLADISVEKIDTTDPIQIENQLTYIITVTNSGPNAAANVVLTDTLPSDVSYIEATPAPHSAPIPLIWNLGTLLVDEVRVITLTVWIEPWAAAIFTNSVRVGSSTPDPTPNDLVATEPTEVGNPTAVTLVSFTADNPSGYEVDLAWDIASGVNVFNFNVYRTPTNEFVNPVLVDQVIWEGAPRGYVGADTVAETGDYWYWLTEVFVSGGESPPVSSTSVTVAGRYKIYMPLVLR
jgi:uncharacterized repeat protein (TIGR01451 family)